LENIYKITKAVNDIIFVTLFLILFPSIYIDQVKFYQSLNDLVIKEKESMATFAKIGMMLNNTVHNFNNKIVTYLSCEYIISTTLKKYKDTIEPEDYEKLTIACEMLSKTSSDMISMISDMRDVIKSKSNKELQNFEVNNAIEQVIKEYKLSYNAKKLDISFEKSKNPLIISDSAIKFIQVLENIIKNGIESSLNPQIKIKVTQQGNSAVIIVSDNGHGIPFCKKCNKQNCLVCTNFEIGKTTKKEGSGTGMVYVQSALKEMNADLKIESSSDGTDVKIVFNKLATKALDDIDTLIHDESLSTGDNAVQV
jgi:signal transduction histidine kinase